MRSSSGQHIEFCDVKLDILTSPDSEFSASAEDLQREFTEGGHSSKIYNDHAALDSGDVLFILSYFKIIPEKALGLHDNNIVVHASPLPAGKGFSPMAWQIVEGSNLITFSLFEAVKELDAGPVYLRSELALNGTELFQEWKEDQNRKVLEMVRDFVVQLPGILKKGIPQEGQETVYPRRTCENDRLDPEKSLASQFDTLRVCNPDKYPAWFDFRGRKYRLRIEEYEDGCDP